MYSINVDYYRRRAAQERELALRSSRQDVAAIHQELASQYQNLIDRAGQQLHLRIVGGDKLAA